MAGIYIASSVIQTRLVMVHLGNVQISEFVRISEIHAKLTSHIMMMLALKNVSTVRIEQNQHWPGNKHHFLTLLPARTKNTVLI